MKRELWNIFHDEMYIFHQPEVTLEISKLSYCEGQRHVINVSAHRTLSPSPDISNPREC